MNEKTWYTILGTIAAVIIFFQWHTYRALNEISENVEELMEIIEKNRDFRSH